jgi:hypothetical protein
MDELIEMGFPFVIGGRNAISAGTPNQEDEERAREWRARQPALRISSLDTVLSLTSKVTTPQLKPLYDEFRERSDRISFLPFADFFLLALANSRYGSTNEQWIQLAEGRKVSIPLLKQRKDNEPPSPLDELQHPPVPRHTIHINIKSTLPQLG